MNVKAGSLTIIGALFVPPLLGIGQTTNSTSDAFANLANSTQADAATRKAEQEQLGPYYQGWDDNWQKDLPSALAAAKAGNKPVLVVITGAPWADESQALETTVFSDQYTLKKLQDEFVLLKYVLTRDASDFPRRLYGEVQTLKRDCGDDDRTSNAPSTTLLPIILVLDPSGKFVAKIVGYHGDSPERFRSTLHQQIQTATSPQWPPR